MKRATTHHTKTKTGDSTKRETLQRSSTLTFCEKQVTLWGRLFFSNDNIIMSSNYKRHSFQLLKTLYPRLSVRAIERTFKVEYGFCFTDAFNALHAVITVVPTTGTTSVENDDDDDDDLRTRILKVAPFLEDVNQIVLKHQRASSNRLPRMEQLDHDLLQEMSHIPQLNEEGKENLLPPHHQGRPKEAEDNDDDTINGATVECGCCMDDIVVAEMVHCGADGRHYFCKTCFQRHFNEQFHGKNQSHVPCMSMDGCESTFAEDQFDAALSPRSKKNYDIRLAQEAVKGSGIDLWYVQTTPQIQPKSNVYFQFLFPTHTLSILFSFIHH
jgi:hypothetical protein